MAFVVVESGFNVDSNCVRKCGGRYGVSVVENHSRSWIIEEMGSTRSIVITMTLVVGKSNCGVVKLIEPTSLAKLTSLEKVLCDLPTLGDISLFDLSSLAILT